MRDAKTRLWSQLAVFAAMLLALDLTYHWYAKRHMSPLVRVDAALRSSGSASAAHPALVFSGVSDMASALEPEQIHAAFAAAGQATPAVVDVTVNGSNTDVRFMALRAYLRAGGKMGALVLGFRGDAVAEDRALNPGYYIGSNATVFEWGSLGDLATYYPRPSFEALDNGCRFALFGATALGAYRSELWSHLQIAEEDVGIRPARRRNKFGYYEEFERLAAGHEDVSGQGTSWALSRWYGRFLELAANEGASVYFVRLPALSRSEKEFFASEESRRTFDEFVDRTARMHRGRLINLSAEPWVEDSLFIDGLHFTDAGAALISRALGKALAGSAPTAAGAEAPATR